VAHARTSIRTAVVAALTGLTTTGSAVTSGRVYPESTLPALSVYTDSEEVVDEENIIGATPKQTRALTLTVEARAKAVATATDSTVLEDLLDLICEEVEVALAADETLALSPGPKMLRLTTTEYELSAEQEQPLGVATMQWRIWYRVDATAPGTIIA